MNIWESLHTQNSVPLWQFIAISCAITFAIYFAVYFVIFETNRCCTLLLSLLKWAMCKLCKYLIIITLVVVIIKMKTQYSATFWQSFAIYFATSTLAIALLVSMVGNTLRTNRFKIVKFATKFFINAASICCLILFQDLNQLIEQLTTHILDSLVNEQYSANFWLFIATSTLAIALLVSMVGNKLWTNRFKIVKFATKFFINAASICCLILFQDLNQLIEQLTTHILDSLVNEQYSANFWLFIATSTLA
uniref:Uncharacterized protein n=1 Tax=Globodera rostochiensis TaxID=31243 RepID=A0A914H9L1_GLORO